MIDPSDLRIDWRCLPTDIRPSLGKRASMVNGPANRTTGGDDHRAALLMHSTCGLGRRTG
jgi:hypothetical protein